MSVSDLHPREFDGDPQIFLHQLEEAYELHKAAGGIVQLRNTQFRLKDKMAPEQIKARENILDIASKLMIAQRDQALDEFCRAWAIFRSKGGGL